MTLLRGGRKKRQHWSPFSKAPKIRQRNFPTKRNLRDPQVLVVFQVSSVDVLRFLEGEEGVLSKDKGWRIWL